jgi:hypothetical protein
MDLYEGESGVTIREPVPLLRLSPDGVVLDTVTMLAGDEVLMMDRGAGLPLFAKDSHWRPHGNEIVLGDADQLEYRLIEPDGRLKMIVRVPGVDLSITQEDLAKEREARYPPNPSPQALDAFSRLPVPESKPAFSNLLVDSEGCVWLEEYRHIWAERTHQVPNWLVFTPEGEWLGSVRLPPRFEPFEMGADYVIGVWLDEMDVEHVQLHRLQRR